MKQHNTTPDRRGLFPEQPETSGFRRPVYYTSVSLSFCLFPKRSEIHHHRHNLPPSPRLTTQCSRPHPAALPFHALRCHCHPRILPSFGGNLSRTSLSHPHTLPPLPTLLYRTPLHSSETENVASLPQCPSAPLPPYLDTAWARARAEHGHRHGAWSKGLLYANSIHFGHTPRFKGAVAVMVAWSVPRGAGAGADIYQTRVAGSRMECSGVESGRQGSGVGVQWSARGVECHRRRRRARTRTYSTHASKHSSTLQRRRRRRRGVAIATYCRSGDDDDDDISPSFALCFFLSSCVFFSSFFPSLLAPRPSWPRHLHPGFSFGRPLAERGEKIRYPHKSNRIESPWRWVMGERDCARFQKSY